MPEITEITILKSIQTHLNHNQVFKWLLYEISICPYLTKERQPIGGYQTSDTVTKTHIRLLYGTTVQILVYSDRCLMKTTTIPLEDPNLFERIVTIVNETN
jgi:hypothetical protein